MAANQAQSFLSLLFIVRACVRACLCIYLYVCMYEFICNVMSRLATRIFSGDCYPLIEIIGNIQTECVSSLFSVSTAIEHSIAMQKGESNRPIESHLAREKHAHYPKIQTHISKQNALENKWSR